MNIPHLIANELSISPQQTNAAIHLLDEGATVPFIARYRKEATDSLDDTQLRQLSERLVYLRELADRQTTILNSITEQGKLTPTLKQAIEDATTKTRLEDLYLPFKPKRRSKAQTAIEAGLDPLADALLTDNGSDLDALCLPYLNSDANINDTEQALTGARYILISRFSEHADLQATLRDFFWQHAHLISRVVKNKATEGEKFSDYFDYSEAIATVPSHRFLAIARGKKAGILTSRIELIDDAHLARCYDSIRHAFSLTCNDRQQPWLWQTVQWSFKTTIQLKLELELLQTLKTRSDQQAIQVFQDNLHPLLMSAPAGPHCVLGLDPAYRTGVKTVVIDATGKLLEHTVIYPHAPQKKWDQALHTLAALCQRHHVTLISIGNGTASRETDQLAGELIQQQSQLKLTKVMISEAGASVYSASELAAQEFPDLDVSYRGAVSIARRLQDPLAELVKIDPKSIGVGQYQHDVNQIKLSRSLGATVEDCVNAVGAEVNTASAALLARISGLNDTIANNIVAFREQHGPFRNRKALKQVPRLGEKTFEQAAGFLRIRDSDQPLDASAVHPERYEVVNAFATSLQQPVNQLIGNRALLNTLDLARFIDDDIGLPTLHDIVTELTKPGRDPRPEFKTAKFSDGINTLSDLRPGMQLQGVITNVANFGAFVDIGVHQDGLVHVSEIADHFVKDLHKEVTVGQIVSVRVTAVDIDRKRISLTMKSQTKPPANQAPTPSTPKRQRKRNAPQAAPTNTLKDQLNNALTRAT